MSTHQPSSEDVRTLPTGPLVNAAACMAAAVGKALPALVGRDGSDGSGTIHTGLPAPSPASLARSRQLL